MTATTLVVEAVGAAVAGAVEGTAATGVVGVWAETVLAAGADVPVAGPTVVSMGVGEAVASVEVVSAVVASVANMNPSVADI